MINRTEIARGIHRISFWDEPDLAAISFPGASYNLFLIAAEKPAIIQTLFRRTFARIRKVADEVVDAAKLQYIVVPHHEGDSSGAINDWLKAAPRATTLCSELCAVLSLRDFAERELTVVKDGEVIDLGSHKLRFFLTPQVNQWDSLMVYEETTQTLFPNDLFSMLGTEIATDRDVSREILEAAQHLGYQPNDRACLVKALDAIGALPLKLIAPMHGPTLRGHFPALFRTYRDSFLAATA
jgi:flavorubredoxin